MTHMAQSVFIVGATGKVGRGLVSQIFDRGDTQNSHHNPTRIVGVASSSAFLYAAAGLREEEVRDFSLRRIEGSRYDGSPSALLGLLRDSKEGVSIVDVTAAPDMLGLHTEAIFSTRHSIVTANKLPLAMIDPETFQRLISETRRYGYRCSVMAGAEAVDKIRDLRDLSNNPSAIVGSFSGTLGYIATELEKGRNLSEIVAEAVQKGYTEPDPTVDLSGMDVASKILILARTAGARISMSDIELRPFVPDRFLAPGDADGLMEGLKLLDSEFAMRISSAMGSGRTLRYVGRYMNSNGSTRISVGLEEVPVDSALGQLRGMYNKIIIKGSETDYIVEAPGAGVETTAENVRRDLLNQLDGRRMLDLAQLPALPSPS